MRFDSHVAVESLQIRDPSLFLFHFFIRKIRKIRREKTPRFISPATLVEDETNGMQ